MEKVSHKPSRPTTASKQQKILKLLGENGGSFRKAIKAAGYSDKYADNPQRIIGTETWKEITEKMLPDNLLAAIHRALLENSDTALRALDLAYKVKGRYKEAEKPIEQQYTPCQIIIEIPEGTENIHPKQNLQY